MARPLRVQLSGALYRVTAQGNERKPIFRDERDRSRFPERLAAVVRRHRLVAYVDVPMRNRYRPATETPEGNMVRRWWPSSPTRLSALRRR